MSHAVSRRELLVAGLTTLGTGAAASTLSAAEASGAARNPLTIESLGNLLTALGVKPTRTESRFDFTFTAKQGEDWNMSMSVVLSTDEKTVWIMAWLDELPQSAADVPRTALLRLLSDNDKMGNGQFFAYVATNHRFVLQRVIANDNISSAGFKAALIELAGTVVNTYPHWAVQNWKQIGTSTAKEDDDAPDANKQAAPARPATSAAAKGAAPTNPIKR
jgi:hypothetical protein